MFLGLVYVWFPVGMIELQLSFEVALKFFVFCFLLSVLEKDVVFCICQIRTNLIT